MKRKRPPDNPTEDLKAQAERFLVEPRLDQGKISGEDENRLVQERQEHQVELEIKDRELSEAQETIEEARSSYEALYDFAPVGYFTFSPKGKIIQVNLTGAGLLGENRDLLIDQPFHLWVAPEFQEAFRTHLQKMFEDGGPQTSELRLLRHDGTHIDVLMGSSPHEDAKEAQRQCYTAIIDITVRKRGEEAISRLAAIVESSDDAIISNTLDGVITSWNQGGERIYGYSVQEVLGQTISILIPAGHTKEAAEIFQRIRGGERIDPFETERLKKDGHLIPVSLTISPITDKAGRIVGASTIARDITKSKQAEEDLRTAAHKWRTTFDAIGDAMALLDGDCKILQCNRSMIKLAGRSFPEIIGHYCWELFHNAFGVTEDCPIYRNLESRRRETKSLLVGDRWFHLIVDPILDEGGNVTGGVLIIVDITPIKSAEEQIKNLNVMLTAIKDMNETLLRTKSEPELFRHICDLMLRVPYIRFIWIGLVEPGSFEVKPVAWAGHEAGYLSVIKVTWDDSPYGRGPIGMAIKTGQPGIVEDIENDPKFSPWRQEALQRGYVSSIAFPLIYEGTTLGSLNVYAEKNNAFQEEELGFLQQVAGDIAVGVRSLRLEQELIASLIKLQVMMLQTVEAIAAMAELRDPYTAGHQRGVSHLACALAREMGLVDDRIEGIRVAGFLHDVGKIVVPAEILSKPGKINDYEMNLIRAHPQAGHDILKNINFPRPVAQIVLQHHERWNGSGYPHGLKGSDILLEAKILAVADVVEAMASHRPYRPALGIEKALEEITKNRGILYDPEVVGVCVKLFTEKGFVFE